VEFKEKKMRFRFILKPLILLPILISIIYTSGCSSPPEVNISTPEISPDVVTPGQAVDIKVSIHSLEQKSTVEYPLYLIINGQEIETREVILKSGDTKNVIFEYTPQSPGRYEIEINGRTAEFEVVEQAQFSIGELTIYPESPETLQELKIMVEITNKGNQPGTFLAELKVNETEVSSRDILVGPGQTVTANASYLPTSSGNYIIEYCGVKNEVRVFDAFGNVTITEDEPQVTEFKTYNNNHFYFKILYPSTFRIDEQDSHNVCFEGYKSSVSVHVDKLTVDDSAEYYFTLVSERNTEEHPSWTTNSKTEVIEEEVIGYKYNYSYSTGLEKYLGTGMVLKEGSFGFDIAFITTEDSWEENQETAIRCLDSFDLPPIFTGSYTNSDLGISLTLPDNWSLIETGLTKTPLEFFSYSGQYVERLSFPMMRTARGELSIIDVEPGTTAEEYIAEESDGAPQTPFLSENFDSGSEYGKAMYANDVMLMEIRYIALAKGSKIYFFTFRGFPDMNTQADSVNELARSFIVDAP